jgi:UDP-N-acetylglucosamine--dolichyl-phosphate N-acetylglucosaminephosphotransferase
MVDVTALILLESFLISFAVCLLTLPRYIKRAKKAGVTGKDIHKPGSPVIAESGGVILVLAYMLGLFFFIPFNSSFISNANESLNLEIVGTAATVMLTAFIGFADDIYEIRWRIKVLTPLLGGVPLAVLRLSNEAITTPFGVWNFADFGSIGAVLFAVILLFAVTASANAINMYAGLNGQEAGSVLIMSLALLFLAYRFRIAIGCIILVPFIGALIAFLYFNWYPSRVFPGDVGTLSMGAVLACVAILASLERAAVIMFIPYFINAILFFIGKLKRAPPPRDGQMNSDGTLPAPSIWSLRSVILRLHPMKEQAMTATMLLLVGFFSVIGMLVYGI